MVMPALLLQKPSRNSKTKDHVAALSRRLDRWEKGDLDELLHEGVTIQNIVFEKIFYGRNIKKIRWKNVKRKRKWCN